MLSIISKHKFLQSKLGLKIDQFYNALVSIIILSIFILAFYALKLPVNPLQFLNASPPIDVTPVGIFSCPVKPVQPSKACVPIDVIPLGRVNVPVKFMQF